MTDYLLRAEDEHPHEPGDEPLFNESVYVNAFDHDRAYGGWMRLGNRANEGYAELAVCLFLPDGRIACQFQRPAITDNRVFDAGGMSYSVETPHESVVMRYSGEVLLVADRALFREPKRLFSEPPRAHCELSWRVRGCSPMRGSSGCTAKPVAGGCASCTTPTALRPAPSTSWQMKSSSRAARS